jgi:hypothetical protein
LFYETPFAESQMGLSAHLRREGFCALSVKMASPVERRREAIAESFLSVKASPRGKTHSVRVTPLSVMGLNPVVRPSLWTQVRARRGASCNPGAPPSPCRSGWSILV